MIVNNQDQLDQVRSILVSTNEPIALDFESNWTDYHNQRWVMGASIAANGGRDYFYIPIAHRPIAGRIPQHNIDRIPVSFWDSWLLDKTVIFHNAKGIDLHMLDQLGFNKRIPKLEDTILKHHYVDENDLHDLDHLSSKYCTVPKNMAVQKALKNDWDNALIEGMHIYAGEDAIATLQLNDYLDNQMVPDYRAAWEEYDRDFMYLLFDIERKGIRLDKDLCAKYEVQCRERMAKIKAELGWDCGSNILLQEKLFSQPPVGYGLSPLTRTAKQGKPQINAAFLEKTNHPVCGLILEYRKLQKQAGSYYANYITACGDGDRLNPNFKMFGTVTGRLSCEFPNLQQIPREDYSDSSIKKMFLPDDGRQLWEIDYRALELRMVAVYSGNKKLRELFEAEQDPHTYMAESLGVHRQVGKMANFLLPYLGGYESLSEKAGISKKLAYDTYVRFRKEYPEIFIEAGKAEAVAQKTGYVRLFSGRRRHFKWESEMRKAWNSIIQGGSFELVKRSMLLADKAGADVRNQVHDSVWVMVDNESEVKEIEHEMSDWTKEAFGLHFSVESKRLR